MIEGVDDVVDITDMQMYADGSFDFFLCSHILEHVADDSQALRELYRILTPGGRGILMTPVMPEGRFDEDSSVTDEGERWRRFAQGDHVRLYDRSTLCSRIVQSGFELTLLDRNSSATRRSSATPSRSVRCCMSFAGRGPMSSDDHVAITRWDCI